MEECLVCEQTKVESTLRCKLCAMGVEFMHKTMGFVFCAEKCAKTFERIYEKAMSEEREMLVSADIVI